MADPRAQALLAAWQAGEPLPAVDPRGDLDLVSAYALQAEFVAARVAAGERMAGFKAALTAAEARAGFGATEPAWSVLFAGGMRADHARVGCSAFVRLLLETEIGYRFNAPLTVAPEAAALPALVREIVPVVELADPALADAQRMRVTDLIATNVASAQVLVGTADSRPVDINAVTVSFERNGEPLHTGSARDGFGDQWQALAWLVERVLAAGYTIEPQHLLITGSLGAVQPGAPGHYHGRWDGLGSASLTLR